MPAYIGTTSLSALYLGSTRITKAYLGTTLLFDETLLTTQSQEPISTQTGALFITQSSTPLAV